MGWLWTKAAAEVADVILITPERQATRAKVAAGLADLGLQITIEYVGAQGWLRGLAQRKYFCELSYVVWQAHAASVVRRYERTREIDIVHHLTWASDSLPSALLASRAPIRIWGPVGGSTRTPLELYRYLSVRGKLSEVARDVLNGVLRRTFGTRLTRHATLVVALNQDVVAELQGVQTSVVLASNTALEPGELAAQASDVPALATGRYRTALFVGRFVPWKGLILAIESLKYAPDWRLVVFGDGRDRGIAMTRAQRLGVADRVEFRGQVARREVLSAFRTADALLFPSFHDSSSWSVGEASALGCPVVCLDKGGSPLQAGRNAHVVPCKPGASLARRIGERLQSLEGRGDPDDSLRAERLPDLLRSWYGVSGEPVSDRHS